MPKQVAQNVYVVDADGHGGERPDWRDRVAERFREKSREYQERIKQHYTQLPGFGTARKGDAFERREGMVEPGARLEDMDLEGIDMTVLFPGGAGEEWALLDVDYATELCRTLNDEHARFCSHAPDRLKSIAKLPMIDPPAAAAELTRCVKELGFVGMVVPQHIRDKNLDHPDFDVVWKTAEDLDATVCVHGGGQAPDQVPLGVDRFDTRLAIHAFTHPVGQMVAMTGFLVGGIVHRFPKLRVGFLESGVGWVPYWLERLDEHWELMPEQAPIIDRKPSEYFKAGNCFVSCEPDESMLPAAVDALGESSIVYASDYYHWDCSFPNTVRIILERGDLSDAVKEKILCDNGKRMYGLS